MVSAPPLPWAALHRAREANDAAAVVALHAARPFAVEDFMEVALSAATSATIAWLCNALAFTDAHISCIDQLLLWMYAAAGELAKIQTLHFAYGLSEEFVNAADRFAFLAACKADRVPTAKWLAETFCRDAAAGWHVPGREAARARGNAGVVNWLVDAYG